MAKHETSVYSAYEHSLLSATSALPLDIKLETLIATAMVIVSVVYSAQELRPIRWNEWAGKIEREGWDPNATIDAGKVRGGGGNPYRALEERKGFWDVRVRLMLLKTQVSSTRLILGRHNASNSQTGFEKVERRNK